ncbi:MAG: ArgP/LysG family DNA-binding transcriptional regulator [Nesterenkonia sp.]|nr:ArgP/LysG family DNA-binding transcriptional regulator [Nesterenkonia sp.]
MNTEHLRAFVTAVDEGTFDAAAALLRISGSAFSQRIKALEREVGQVLLTRTVPVRATTAGADLLRTARQIVLLEDDARRRLGLRAAGDPQEIITLSAAVNADSLATWFIGVLREAAAWDDVELHVVSEDQGHTQQLLRSGTVLAAVAESPAPVSGCRSTRLGTMRYWPVATRELVDRSTSAGVSGGEGVADLSRMPRLDFSVRDPLQRAGLSRVGVDRTPVTHLIPSVEAYNASVFGGLGWGMIPERMMPDGVVEGTHEELTVLEEIGPAESTLYWQRWTTATPALDRLTEAVRRAADRGLR